MSGVLHKRRGWVSVPNATAHDGRLSYRALGLLLGMLARPPDKSSFDMRVMSTGMGREGRDALRSAANELREFGYVWTFQIPGGPRGGVVTHTVVSDDPMTEDVALEVLKDRQGSDYQAPGTKAPGTKAPGQSTPLPTEGHSYSSLRSQGKSMRADPLPNVVQAANGQRADGSCRQCDVIHPAATSCAVPAVDPLRLAGTVKAELRAARLAAGHEPKPRPPPEPPPDDHIEQARAQLDTQATPPPEQEQQAG